MEKYRAIPEGYMTVGEVAKKLGSTVRTLQYYDKEGLLKPSLESEGGRRLYNDKDVVKLHQILTLRHLGFPVDDIKNRLIEMDTPEQIGAVLTEQIQVISNQIKRLNQSLKETEALRDEVVQMKTVDFKKYADIIVSLEMKNENYWMIKHFDEDTIEHCRTHFTVESAKDITKRFHELSKDAIKLIDSGVKPTDEAGIEYAKRFWDMVTEFTGGDMNVLQKLMNIVDVEGPNNEWQKTQERIIEFVGPALEAYFNSLQQNPVEGLDLPEERYSGKKETE